MMAACYADNYISKQMHSVTQMTSNGHVTDTIALMTTSSE